MIEIWTTEQEAAKLRERFAAVPNKAAFARTHGVPGGASMQSQHLSGHRPMSLAAATAYATGFGVTLAEISPRMAKEVAAASSPAPHHLALLLTLAFSFAIFSPSKRNTTTSRPQRYAGREPVRRKG